MKKLMIVAALLAGFSLVQADDTAAAQPAEEMEQVLRAVDAEAAAAQEAELKEATRSADVVDADQAEAVEVDA